MRSLLRPLAATVPRPAVLPSSNPLHRPRFSSATSSSSTFPLHHSRLLLSSTPLRFALLPAGARKKESNTREAEIILEHEEEEEKYRTIADEIGGVGAEEKEEEFGYSSAFGRGGEEKDYDRDPELAEILGSCFEDPQNAQARVEERIRKKRNKIVHTKTGSGNPMKVIFNKFNFSNSYIWFEFCNPPLPNDVSLICDTIRSWHIIGRLGGCNSMNMQLSQAPLDNKRPSYDAIQGANVTPTTFYNIGDLEVQDNLARIWVDIGTSESLLLDVLINALVNISSEVVGIKQLVFGGTEFENWKESLTSEDAGCSVHKI